MPEDPHSDKPTNVLRDSSPVHVLFDFMVESWAATDPCNCQVSVTLTTASTSTSADLAYTSWSLVRCSSRLRYYARGQRSLWATPTALPSALSSTEARYMIGPTHCGACEQPSAIYLRYYDAVAELSESIRSSSSSMPRYALSPRRGQTTPPQEGLRT